ncbi:MAG: hypothetical protein WA542_00400, partial [Candidatus Acidiferrum sp.]
LQKRLDEPQPRVSDLMTGKISKFSLETLSCSSSSRVASQSEWWIHRILSTLSHAFIQAGLGC